MAFFRFLKSQILGVVITFFYGFMLFGQFLQVHFVHDGYVVFQQGYDAIIPQFYTQGRFVSAWFYEVLWHTKLPFSAAMFVSVGLSVVFLVASTLLVVHLVWEQCENMQTNANWLLFVYLACASLFFNLFVLESLLFLENCVMSFGVFVTVFAAYLLICKKKLAHVFFSFLLLLLGSFCYQADIAFFVPLVALFAVSSYAKPTKNQNGFWQLCKQVLLACGIFSVVCVLNYGTLRFLGSSDHRVKGNVDIVYNIKQCADFAVAFFKNTAWFSRNYVYSAFLLFFLLALMLALAKQKQWFVFVLQALVAVSLVLFALLPHVAMVSTQFYIMPRSVMAIAATVGILMVAFALHGKKVSGLVLGCCLVFVMFVSLKLIDMQKSNFATNQLDNQEITYMVDKILAYEAKTKQELKHIYVAYDAKPTQNRSSIGRYRDATISVLAVEWMPRFMLNYRLGRNYQSMKMPEKEYNELFKDKNWDSLSDEQFVFVDDTLYICIY